MLVGFCLPASSTGQHVSLKTQDHTDGTRRFGSALLENKNILRVQAGWFNDNDSP